jgi:acyl-ACP thioesterase
MAVEMKRLPSRGEQIDVYTWVSDYGRLFTTRNMTIADEAGVEIGAAVTLWAMIDLDTRRPLDLSPLSNKGTSLVDRQPPIEKPRKVGAFECTLERPYAVVYSDIDFNGHVGSMKYIEWMVDSLPPRVPTEMSALRFDINYIHEARLGDALTICSATDETGVHHFDIRNAEGASICKATITT